jgi:hypothetical protein
LASQLQELNLALQREKLFLEIKAAKGVNKNQNDAKKVWREAMSEKRVCWRHLHLFQGSNPRSERILQSLKPKRFNLQ